MNTVCTHCQAINRIPDDRIEDVGKMRTPGGHDLFDGEVINATGEGKTLDKLLKDDLPVVSTSKHRGRSPP